MTKPVKKIITKTQIPNNSEFDLYANYYNLMDAKGLGFKICFDSEIKVEKLYRKNGFEYLILEDNNKKEFFILPNERIEEYADTIVSKIEFCKTDEEVLNLLIDEMN